MAKPSASRKGGFEEAPQREFTGVPLSGPVSGWAEEISRAAEAQDSPAKGKNDRPQKPGRKIPERSAAPARTARGTSMGGAASARERAAAGLNPVAGLDVSLEEADSLTPSGVTATVAALTKLIEGGDPNLKSTWVPHRPPRPEKSEGGVPLRMVTE